MYKSLVGIKSICFLISLLFDYFDNLRINTYY
jgi:hypothetical protein